MLILHGPMKSPAYEQMLHACVDCILTYSRDTFMKQSSRLRLLKSQTRRPETPARIACAWSTATTGRFEIVEDLPARRFEKHWQPLERLLKQHPAGATFPELWNCWPPDTPKPSHGLPPAAPGLAGTPRVIARRGTNGDPRRYWVRRAWRGSREIAGCTVISK